MIRDKMTEEKDSLEAEAQRPRVFFLWAAGVTSVAAMTTYFFEDMMVGPDGDGALAYALLLGILIFLSMFLVLCFRVPSIGNRLLGYDVVIISDREKEKSSLQYTGSFKVESGLTEKRMSSRRKQARHSRKKLAEVTRQMNSGQESSKESGE